MKPHQPHLYAKDSWYVDLAGNTHRLGEHAPQDVHIEDHGKWAEIHLLAPSDGTSGREVLDSYVLHPAGPASWINSLD